MTGDTFRPALLTDAAILRLTQLSGLLSPHPTELSLSEPQLENPQSSYPLDPNRGVEVLEEPQPTAEGLLEIVPADSLSDLALGDHTIPDLVPIATEQGIQSDNREIFDRAMTQAAELVEVRNSMNSGYNLQNPSEERHIFSALTM